MIKTYRFYFDLGVPVFDWPTGKKIVSHKFRRGHRSIFAYSLTDAMERLAKEFVQKYGAGTKLNLTEGFVSKVASPRVTHREDWDELNLDSANLAAFTVGMVARQMMCATQ